MTRTILYSFMIMLLSFSCKNKAESTKPTRGVILESVYASGNIKAENEYKVYASVSGIIKKVLIKEGDLVSIGQPLFIIENTTPELNTENARIAYELAKENYSKGSDKLEELNLVIALAKEKYLSDSMLFIRQKNLWDKNIGTLVELEQKKLSMEASNNALQSAKSRYGQGLKQLKNELDRSKNNYAISKSQQKDYTIKSEMDGKVYEILVKSGEITNPQVALSKIGAADSFILELQVDENDIVKINIGQQVVISMDSYKDKTFTAVVSRILPLMNERSRSFLVEATFVNGPDKLYPNLTAEVNIIIGTKNDAIIIPRNYLVDDTFVMISAKERKKVKTGMKNYQQVEVLSGLDTATIIYKPK